MPMEHWLVDTGLWLVPLMVVMEPWLGDKMVVMGPWLLPMEPLTGVYGALDGTHRGPWPVPPMVDMGPWLVPTWGPGWCPCIVLLY